MVAVQPVEVPRRPIAGLNEVIGLERTTRLLAAAADFRKLMGNRVIWTFSSTATGGGVAEMLQTLVGYTKDLAIDIRWFVIGGDLDFFKITKRLHNRIHGQPGDHGPLGATERAHMDEVIAANADILGEWVNPGDLVLLHDPQTTGLAGPLTRRGAHVVWRSHIGIDRQNDLSNTAWDFLRPYLVQANGYAFTRPTYVPSFLPESRTWIIPPSIDPFSAKNEPMDPAVVRAILTQVGLLSGSAGAPCCYTRRDGSPGIVSQPASVAAEGLPGPDDPVVVQVSRWDRLKDMIGVMRGFAAHIAPAGAGWLVLAGPSVEAVTDDPEGAVVYAECLAEWRRLPPVSRSRVILATLPMGDVDENAAVVNALQRHARVITQKSIAEGFGLTVAEGMWKGRPVVGSAVGGIQDQITDDTGVLLDDPTDLTTFGHAVRRLLDQSDVADRMGESAREHVRDHFVGDIHLLRYADLFSTLMAVARA